MSDTTKPVKKTVKIKENDLVELIDNIVTEAVASVKVKWIAEQESKNADAAKLLENRIAALESKLLVGKK